MQHNVFIRLVAGSILLFTILLSGPLRNPLSNVASKEWKNNQERNPKQISIWKKISDKLCPALVPQSTKYARRLFHLAQLEILEGNVSQTTNCSTLKVWNATTMTHPEFSALFFEYPDHWQTYSHLDPGKHQFFSYLSIWKCANTQLRIYQQKIFNNTMIPFQGRYRQTRYINKITSANTKKKKTTTIKRISDCTVAAIRDPISHFLSGYNEIEFRINVDLKDPREAVAKQWPFGKLEPGSTERFEQFVTDLVTCPIGKQLPGVEEGNHNDLEFAHVYSMSAILRLLEKDRHISNYNKNFYYLPSLANLSETWVPFVLASCPAAFTEDTKAKFLTTKMRDERWHETSKDPLGTYKAAKMAVKKEGPVAKALCAIHLMDYACWKDLPDGVPKVCMDLYLDYHSRNLLL